MPAIIFIPIITATIISIFIVLLYVRYRKKNKFLLQDQTGLIPANASYEFLDAKEDKSVFKSYNTPLTETLQRHDVSSIYLIHGTFVGNDPFQIIDLLGEAFPKLGTKLISTIKERTKQTQNIFAKDLGNFTDEHVDYIRTMTGNRFNVHNITWSSGNNHLARVKGAIDLIQKLSTESPNSRVLLIGHSHAGQLFALITQLMNNPALEKKLKTITKKIIPDSDWKDINKQIKKMRTLKFDIVTMGTPQRYEWRLSDNIKLLHFINHRGTSVFGGDVKGALNTLDGDYIQQWGIVGSDIVSPLKEEKLINIELDSIFGAGSNLEELRKNIVFRKRLHSEGHHILVNYRDNAKYPNFLLTIFGHGSYTKFGYLGFHFEEICKRLYK